LRKAVVVFLLLLCCYATDAVAGSDTVSKSDMGADWPFEMFDKGMLYCKQLDAQRTAVWINGADGYTYLLNGQSISWHQKIKFKGPNGKQPKEARKVTKSNLAPMIQKGLALCP
jgi:hypothetical protein